ncbi:MAG TPA: 2-amino-4-hydroxy-6-hydroxymethyldihydropteridine diphosphokinase [Vicinamibacterales bacterium]|nr:2-amino-4-hydroxy-6-hydroxymethyldihydropteridine diphosphokinase [Vicinamibacterales bacterium]
MDQTRRVAVALGSNVGDRLAAIAFAAERLTPILSDLRVSDIVETEPEGEGFGTQPLFLNAVIVGRSDLGARALLDALRGIEADFGRERFYPGAPRTLDLDLVLVGDEIIEEPGLHVPHPRFRNRFFVLGPMAGIAADLRDPVTGLTVGELLRSLLRDEER